jgi:hypothetical protein
VEHPAHRHGKLEEEAQAGLSNMSERHMPVVILMPSKFLESCFLFLESLKFNSRY